MDTENFNNNKFKEQLVKAVSAKMKQELGRMPMKLPNRRGDIAEGYLSYFFKFYNFIIFINTLQPFKLVYCNMKKG